jgi:hypothetical protein
VWQELVLVVAVDTQEQQEQEEVQEATSSPKCHLGMLVVVSLAGSRPT